MSASEPQPDAARRRRYRRRVICTTDKCRSPIGERLESRPLRLAGVLAAVRSGGTHANGEPMAIDLMNGFGADGIEDHDQRN